MQEAKPKSFKQVYAKNIKADIKRVFTYHLDDDSSKIDQEDVIECDDLASFCSHCRVC